MEARGLPAAARPAPSAACRCTAARRAACPSSARFCPSLRHPFAALLPHSILHPPLPHPVPQSQPHPTKRHRAAAVLRRHDRHHCCWRRRRRQRCWRDRWRRGWRRGCCCAAGRHAAEKEEATPDTFGGRERDGEGCCSGRRLPQHTLPRHAALASVLPCRAAGVAAAPAQAVAPGAAGRPRTIRRQVQRHNERL